MSDRTLDDGFGNLWHLCDRAECGLEIVRPGKVQCWCDGHYVSLERGWKAGPGPAYDGDDGIVYEDVWPE